MIKVAIVGASGRMGQNLIKASLQNPQIKLTVAVAKLGSSCVNKDAGKLAGVEAISIKVGDDLLATVNKFDILIDFTSPEASMDYLRICLDYAKPIVIGTTGHTYVQKCEIKAIAQQLPIVFSPNMSVGVNLSLKLLEMTAKTMGDYCDIEIIEAHHRHKVDAPSGTALRMGEVVAETLKQNLADCAIYGRKGDIGERNRKAIGFSTIRAGDIVGEHTAMFADVGERLEITHKATNRMTFAKGALRATVWLKDKPAGLYDMQDVLGLRN